MLHKSKKNLGIFVIELKTLRVSDENFTDPCLIPPAHPPL
jgi:hypothetical protein